jgi:hypothetical protein
MTRPHHKPGAFVRIRLPDGSFGYGRLLAPPDVAFYDYRTSEPESDLETIGSKSTLFDQSVMTSGLKRWDYLGEKPLEAALASPVVRFMQDLADFRKCTIVDSAGNQRSATPEECIGIERSAVWDARQLEKRLLDTLLGHPNSHEMHSRVRLK